MQSKQKLENQAYSRLLLHEKSENMSISQQSDWLQNSKYYDKILSFGFQIFKNCLLAFLLR